MAARSRARSISPLIDVFRAMFWKQSWSVDPDPDLDPDSDCDSPKSRPEVCSSEINEPGPDLVLGRGRIQRLVAQRRRSRASPGTGERRIATGNNVVGQSATSCVLR